MESDDCKICECQVSGQGRALDIILDIIIGCPQLRRIFGLSYMETTLQVTGSGTAHLIAKYGQSLMQTEQILSANVKMGPTPSVPRSQVTI